MNSRIKTISAILIVAVLSIYAYYTSNADPRNGDPKYTYASTSPTKAVPQEEDTPPQRVHPVRITGKVTFAGETVPLNDADVRERFDRELMVNTFWHSNTMLNFKLANKYFEIIDAILLEEGVPLDFKYLAVAESGLRNVKSPAKASGIWQIMSATGKSYGLKINDEVDERYHLEKATRVACKYLNEAKAKFGTWALAAASYNMGMPGLQKRIDEQMVNNYYDLYLNSETARYMYRILAYKMVFENANKFGFYLEEDDLYEPIEYETMNIGGDISDLAAFAKTYKTTYKMLKVANPWLRGKKLTVKDGEFYEVKIPKNYLN
ncbi:MAG: lytic transglycosylase domain-containing protein [Chitinophagales bacterium]